MSSRLSLARVLIGLAILPLTPAVLADETLADCEDGQPFIGYARTEPLRTLVQDAAGSQGASVAACEGEQWDGQDPIAPAEPPSCSPMVHPVVGEPTTAFCLGSDPNGSPGDDVANPLGARVSSRDLREAYLAANVVWVGRVAVYAGTCGAGEAGLEGEAACGGTRELRSGVYVRENTPGNIVMQTFECLRRIICDYPSENDCSYELYLYEQMSGQHVCARDNTAFGIGLVLV